MSFLAKLKIENVEYNVLSLDWNIEQSFDDTGLPIERTQAGQIKVTYESTKDTEIISWALSNRGLKNGELTLYNRDSVSTFRKIEFRDAYCVNFNEKFDNINNKPLLSEILISARELIIKDAKHVNNWPATS